MGHRANLIMIDRSELIFKSLGGGEETAKINPFALLDDLLNISPEERRRLLLEQSLALEDGVRSGHTIGGSFGRGHGGKDADRARENSRGGFVCAGNGRAWVCRGAPVVFAAVHAGDRRASPAA